jgi:hypothetical protein
MQFLSSEIYITATDNAVRELCLIYLNVMSSRLPIGVATRYKAAGRYSSSTGDEGVATTSFTWHTVFNRSCPLVAEARPALVVKFTQL